VTAELARQGLAAHEIAKVAVVIGVNASVPITSIAERQLCDLYSGAITNWRELGGPDLRIAPHTRPAGEVDADVVLAGVKCLQQTALASTVVSIEKPEDMAAALATTRGAVGMTSLPFVEQSGGRVRALALGGVSPTPANVRQGTYPLSRQSFLLTHTSPSPAVARFLAFVRSADGASAIAANGAVPAP
jgi:phosphate transport system substrate-binding protein